MGIPTLLHPFDRFPFAPGLATGPAIGPRLAPWLLLLVAWSGWAPADTDETGPQFVGRAQCATCHPEQHARWLGSHHDLAMQEATEASVLGDFNDRELAHFGVVSRFYRNQDRFWVRTDGPDGTLQDYPIRYSFGVYPLQQYLIEFPGGRLQALDIAWDSRTKEQGGQRWMHLHPQDPVRHDDVLHWTGPNLNWNYMCADCHATNLRKGFEAASNSYHTTWSEMDVSCEACHGPGSRHLQWAQARAKGEPTELPDLGLTVRLDERSGITWTLDPATGKVKRSAPRQSSREIQVCARCHSRRSQMADGVVAGQPLLDGFLPALLTAGLYFPDGQIQDEVYEWGSFLQSKMCQAGISCSDCHDPHSGQVRLTGDALCVQCHPAERYATTQHHRHPEGSSGARCLGCHMPTRTYMVVDARHDHGFRVPRPDQSVRLGTPNACNQCHGDRTPQWAADQVKAWYGRPAEGHQGYAEALAAAWSQSAGAGDRLQEIARDIAQPAIARATALQALGAYPDRATLGLVQQAIQASDPLERLGALGALEPLEPPQRALATPLLWDELKAIRITAARLLATLPAERFPESVRSRLAQGIEEYIAVQQFNAERPESQINLGTLYADLGRPQDAELAYRQALKLQPRFIPAYVNLAHLLGGLRREQEAEGLLRRGLELNPQGADLAHALGLSLVRQKRSAQALDQLARAAELASDNARYAYVYGVALQSAGKLDQAIEVLEATSRRHPANVDILVALTTFNRDAGRRGEALKHARALQVLRPADPSVERLVRELAGPWR